MPHWVGPFQAIKPLGIKAMTIEQGNMIFVCIALATICFSFVTLSLDGGTYRKRKARNRSKLARKRKARRAY